jgi:mono/diheme cytochrome c family protein
MSHVRQFGIWIAAALVAVAVLLMVLRVQYQFTQERFALAANPHPAEGRLVFESKGCAKCHGADAEGTASAPALRDRRSLSSLPLLVTSIWNHVPRMYDAMEAAHLAYPSMSNEEAARLVSYLYYTGLDDGAGDPVRGREVFRTKQCAACHRTGSAAPTPADLGHTASPLMFTQALWNHGARMGSEMRARGMEWPRLQARDVRDLFAFLRAESGSRDFHYGPTADPQRGWELFQSKGCMDCHALGGRETSTPRLVPSAARNSAAPALGAEGSLPLTLSGFGEAMLNHFPNMNRAITADGKNLPAFEGNDLADVAVFLYSLHYLEPSGSPHVGGSVFVWRGCAKCHGDDGSGGTAPGLRGRGQSYTAVRLATGLWAHGGRMYEQTRRSGQPWPHLEESDIGDLLSFLNTPLEKSGSKR